MLFYFFLCDHPKIWRKLDFQALCTLEFYFNSCRSIGSILDSNNCKGYMEEAIASFLWEVVLDACGELLFLVACPLLRLVAGSGVECCFFAGAGIDASSVAAQL